MLSSYRLSRIPQDESLQAWNAADELALSRLEGKDLGQVLVVNDNFGALALGLANHQPDWWNDSAMSEQALRQNCYGNQVDVPNIIDSEADLSTYDTLIIHIPKSLKLFQWQLQTVLNRCSEQTRVYALAMVKHLGKGHIEVMNRLFGHSNPGRAEKKARVIELSHYQKVPPVETSKYRIDELDMTLMNLPGCFAESKADPGGRMFAQSFATLTPATQALDLGCGNGLLAAALLKHQPNIHISLVDESRQAINSAKLNLTSLYPEAKLDFVHSNGLHSIPDDQYFDLILCNPPFHQENTVTEQIALRLFSEASKHLSKTGEIWIVANRSLNYYFPLKSLFKTVKTDSKHAKFTLYQCSLSD